MDKEIYEYLRKYGLSDKEIDYIEDENDNIFYINLGYAIKIINFLESKDLEKNEVKQILINNPYMITVGKERLALLTNIYDNQLKLTKEELKYLLLNNPNIYNVSPIELDKIIAYLIEGGYQQEMIKNIILYNPDIVEMKLEKVKKLINHK